ncbi:MAG: DUF2442 domain-containing protein [Deltaproteobacteria bacterium]|nr:DUF2442 domain-containing protein [Deltaproteobacteria bacterium]
MTTSAMTVFLQDNRFVTAIPRSRHVRIIRKFDLGIAERAKNLFVFSSAVKLPQVAELVQEANSRHHLKALFVWQDVADCHLLPQMIARANLKALRNMVVHSEINIPRRIINAWLLGAQEQLIANATLIDGSKIFVISCDAETFEVPFESIPALNRIPIRERGLFKIAEDGSYLHWPKPDVHINLETIHHALNPELRKRYELERITHDERFGTAIASLRKKYGLNQTDIPGLSDRQVRRIESGERPSFESLKVLAKAHGKDLNDYLNEISDTMTEQKSK